jgi:hypothetical protein
MGSGTELFFGVRATELSFRGGRGKLQFQRRVKLLILQSPNF